MAGRAHSVQEYLVNRNDPARKNRVRTHTLWTISEPSIAAAQGFTTVARTTSSGGRDLVPLMFDVKWKQVGAPPDADPASSFLKPHNILFADDATLGPTVGHAVSDWKARLVEALDAFTWDEENARSKLAGCRPTHGSVPPIVQSLLPGDVIEVNGSRAVVLSGAPIQQLHPYASMLVAPMRACATAAKHPYAITWHGERLAFEELQTCEPLVGEDEVRQLGSIGALLANAREALARLTLLSAPRSADGLSPGALLAYLEATKIDRGGGVPKLILPARITGPAPPRIWEPKIVPTPKQRGATDTSRELLVAERFDGYRGALRLEFWHVARQIVLRIVAERGQITKLSQVGFGPLEGDRTALFEDVSLDGWMWETPIGALEDLDQRTLSLHVIADGHAITAEPSFSLNQPGS